MLHSEDGTISEDALSSSRDDLTKLGARSKSLDSERMKLNLIECSEQKVFSGIFGSCINERSGNFSQDARKSKKSDECHSQLSQRDDCFENEDWDGYEE